MASTLDTDIVRDFIAEIAVRLNEAAIIAKTAQDLSAQNLGDRAFDTLLHVETLIHDSSTLLNATSVMRRRNRERDLPFD